MREQGQHVHSRQKAGQMLLAVAEIMFQVVALGFECVVVFVLDFSAAAARGDVLVGNFPVAHPGAVIGRFAVFAGDGDLAPVDLQRALAFDERNIVGVAVDMLFPVALGVLGTRGDRVQVRALLQQPDSLGQMRMRGGLAGEDEVPAVEQHVAAERLVGIDVVTQQRDVAVQSLQIPPGLFIDPALGGVDFAVLLVMAVLGHDELRTQGNGMLLSRGDDHGGYRTVVVDRLAAFVIDLGTFWLSWSWHHSG